MSNLYQGEAEVVSVDAGELKEYQKRDLTEEQAEAGFVIDLTLQPADKSFGQCHVEIEITDRECTGKLAGRVQKDVALEQLQKQNLISQANIENLEEVFSASGKKVNIYQKDRKYNAKNGTEKTAIDTYFSSFSRLPKDVLAKRIAMLRGGAKPAPKTAASSANPFD